MQTQQTQMNDWHLRRGARLAAPASPVQPLTFGDVPGEYWAARNAAAVFDTSASASLLVEGADASAFLHRMLANDVRGLAVGAGQDNLLLTSKGKIFSHFELTRIGEQALLCSLPPGEAEKLLGALDRYLFAEQVRLCDASAEQASLECCGPQAQVLLSQILGGSLELAWRGWREWAGTAFGTLQIEAVPVAGLRGFRLRVRRENLGALWEGLLAAGARPAGLVAYDSLRVEAGRARFGIDIDAEIYPQEARLESAFSLSKGCYVGQEVVAKIDTYGGLNKRLVALKIANDEPVESNARLWLEEEGEWRDVGQTTSWAYSFALDSGLALAYVKKKRQDPGTVLRIGEGPARGTIVELPLRTDAV